MIGLQDEIGLGSDEYDTLKLEAFTNRSERSILILLEVFLKVELEIDFTTARHISILILLEAAFEQINLTPEAIKEVSMW